MIIRLYNSIGSTLHGDDIELPDVNIPRIGEWIVIHKDDPSWRKENIYRVVSVDHTIRGKSHTIWVTAYEAQDEHRSRANAAIHDEHSDYEG